MTQLPRRVILGRALQVLAAAAVIPAIKSQAATTCEGPSSDALRSSLHYIAKSSDPAKACHACTYFTNATSPCGNCAIMSGPVNMNGHCDSWTAKSS